MTLHRALLLMEFDVDAFATTFCSYLETAVTRPTHRTHLNDVTVFFSLELHVESSPV